ncbi:MAG: hypothetical protein IKE75_02465 [Bacilli bacterium]|nr:hypothetical protein [Bacilli bacterium]
MEKKFFTLQLLDLLQKQSYYSGKLSTINEIDDEVSRVYLPEESAALREPVYYHNNNGKEMIEIYNQSGCFVRDAKKLVAAKIETWNTIRENSCFFGTPSDKQIESFWISPKGVQGNFGERILETISKEEGIDYEDILGMLDICKRLGLIAQLNELNHFEGMDHDAINRLMYGECVEVIQRLEFSEDYDLARDVYIYSNFKLEDYSSVVEAAESLGENFDKGIESIVKTKKLTK